MRVVIKEREYEYESDYPAGWQFSAGDPFKLAVRIGKYSCFVKRFEKKQPADISGWQLLEQLRGKFVPNLPRLYDIVPTTEDQQPVYYLFYEHLAGETLQQRVTQHEPVDLTRLTGDVFRALAAIHRQEHWFADFTEKNIFYEEINQRYLLIDLDSAQPVTERPHHELYGDKAYWALVQQFYREEVGDADLSLTELPGPVLNYLQVIFLVLRLKLYQAAPEQPYQTERGYEQLVGYLAAAEGDFRQVFARAYQDSRSSNYLSWEGELQASIEQHLVAGAFVLPVSEPAEVEVEPPVIRQFGSSATEVQAGEPFTLSWQVEQATQLELLRNNQFYKTLPAEVGTLPLQERLDGRAREVKFVLRAANQQYETESPPVSIQVTSEKVIPPEPIIISFTTSKEAIKRGESFELSWQVTQTTSLKLFRNGNLEQDLPMDISRLTRKIAEDEQSDAVTYSLQAANAGYLVESSPLVIKIIQEDKRPNILSFSADNSVVKNGETVRLRWQVENATFLKIKRNGVVLQDLNPKKKAVDIAEAFGNQEKEVVYNLVTGNATGEQESNSLILRIDKGVGDGQASKNLTIKLTLLVLVLAIIGILLVAFKAFYPGIKNLTRAPVVAQLIPMPFFAEGKNVLVTGKNLPSEALEIQIYFNSVPGKIIKKSDDSVVVLVPQLGKRYQQGKVNVSFVVEGDTLQTWDTLFVRRIRMDKPVVAEGSTFQLFGNYFPSDAGAMQVIINQVASPLLTMVNDTTLRVAVPFLNNTVTKAKVGVIIQGDTTYAPDELAIRRIMLNRAVAAEGESLLITGSFFPGNPQLIQVFFNSIPGRLTQLSDNKLQVTVPRMGKLPLKNQVAVSVIMEGDTIQVPEKLTIRATGTVPIPPTTTDNSLAAFIKNNLKVETNIPRGRTIGGFNVIQITVNNNSMFDMEAVFVEVICRKDEVELKKFYSMPWVLAHTSSKKEVSVNDFGLAADIKAIRMVGSNIININSTQRNNHLKR